MPYQERITKLITELRNYLASKYKRFNERRIATLERLRIDVGPFTRERDRAMTSFLTGVAVGKCDQGMLWKYQYQEPVFTLHRVQAHVPLYRDALLEQRHALQLLPRLLPAPTVREDIRMFREFVV